MKQYLKKVFIGFTILAFCFTSPLLASNFSTGTGGGATTEAGLESDLTDVTDVITNNDLPLDHGTDTTGLTDDDHTQYQKETDFTAGSVLFRGSSVITEDNTALFYDDTNNRLGIGTALPEHDITLDGDRTIATLTQSNSVMDFQSGTTGGGQNHFRFLDENNNPMITISPSGFTTQNAMSNTVTSQGGANLIVGASSGNDLRLTSNGTGTIVMYLQGSSRNVTIGPNDVDLGQLGVDGDSDEIQLVVQGNSTQTSNLATLEQSDGTDVFSVANSGIYFTLPTTVSSLPAAGTAGRIAVVSDGNAADDCTTGGGSTYNLCLDNGSAWINA